MRAEGGTATTAPAATRSGRSGSELERVWGDALWRLKLHAELRQAGAAAVRTPRPPASRKG